MEPTTTSWSLLVIAGRKMNVLIREALSARFPIDKWELNHLDYVGSEVYCGEDSPAEGAQGSDGSNKLRYQCAKDFYGNYISFVDGFHSSDGHHTRYTVDVGSPDSSSAASCTTSTTTSGSKWRDLARKDATTCSYHTAEGYQGMCSQVVNYRTGG